MSLEIKLGGLIFKNPIILGSAGYAEDENGMRRFIKRGFAGIVTKSTSKEKLIGAPPPRVFWYDPYRRSLIDNAEAHRNPGIDKMSKTVKACKDLAEKENCRIIGSIAAGSSDEAIYVARKFDEAGVDAIEVDMTCPNVGEHLGSSSRGGTWNDLEDPVAGIDLIKALKNEVNVPIWPKPFPAALFFNGERLEKESKADAFAYIGAIFPTRPLGLAINIETGQPIFSGNTLLKIKKRMKFRPLAGIPPLVQTTVLTTALLRRRLSVPLVPSGGITRGFDIIQVMMAGGSAVEVCTAAYKDLNVAQSMLREIGWFLSKSGYTKLQEICGISLPNLPFELFEIDLPPPKVLMNNA